jgi:hypothetical protein
MLFNYQSPMGQEPEGEQFDPLPTLNNNASVDSGMSLYPSAQSYDSPSNFIGQGPVQLGAAQRQRLNRQYDGLMSQVGQQAVSSGLYNTTVPITQEQAVERARGQALTGLEGQLMDEEMGAYTGMTGDALLSELQNRLARTSEIDAATSQGIVDNISNVLDQIAFLEAKNEKGPNLDKLREIVSLLGQSMAETNGVPSVVFPGFGSTYDDDNGFTGADDTFGNAGFTPQVNQTPSMAYPSMESQLQDYANSGTPLKMPASGSSHTKRKGGTHDMAFEPASGDSGSGGLGGMGGGGVGSVSVGSPYPGAAAGRLSNPVAQEEAANAGLKVGVGDNGLPAVAPPNRADFDSDDSYAAAWDSFQKFREEYPEHVMATSEDVAIAADELPGVGDIGKFEEGAGTVLKPKGDPRPFWQKQGYASWTDYDDFTSREDEAEEKARRRAREAAYRAAGLRQRDDS